MGVVVRIAVAAVVALVVGFGVRAYDDAHGAEWVVSPAQIADAKASGSRGVTMERDSIAVLPIRSEMADILPFKWAFSGIAAGALAFVAMRNIKG